MKATYNGDKHTMQIEMTREQITMIDEALFKMIECEIEKDPNSETLDRFNQLRHEFNDAIREAQHRNGKS